MRPQPLQARSFALAGFLLVLLAAGCDLLAPAPPGERLWRKLCADCHGIDGAGNTVGYMGNPYADLLDNDWKHGGGDRYSVESVIRQGIFGEMPANDQLTAEQMTQLLDYFYKLRGETP